MGVDRAGLMDSSRGVYPLVRFGNVLGSRGSVLPTLRRQIETGGPVIVTRPDVTRYFMTTEEAVALVFQAGAVGEPREVLVLDVDSPVRIDDVAPRLIARSGEKVELEYTGLLPGETLHERLLGAHEVGTTRSHPTIVATSVAPIFPSDLKSLPAAWLVEVATSPGKSAEPQESVTSKVF